MPSPPKIHCTQQHPMLVVPDLPATVEYYQHKLGFSIGFVWGEPVSFAGMNLDKVSVHLSPGESRGNAIYFMVGNADKLYNFHKENNVEVVNEPGVRDYEMRDYAVRDPWGNTLAFGHPIYHLGEPIYIKRVDLPVRIEKRLAALLKDLAEHKNMSIGSCLEETLLHTFEQTPNQDGVASPHTPATHEYINELRKKHGIDYDTHASYRFKEK